MKKNFWKNLVHACALCGSTLCDDASYLRYIKYKASSHRVLPLCSGSVGGSVQGACIRPAFIDAPHASVKVSF